MLCRQTVFATIFGINFQFMTKGTKNCFFWRKLTLFFIELTKTSMNKRKMAKEKHGIAVLSKLIETFYLLTMSVFSRHLMKN